MLCFGDFFWGDGGDGRDIRDGWDGLGGEDAGCSEVDGVDADVGVSGEG